MIVESDLLTDFKNLLSAYLIRWKTIDDCSEWFASIDWGKIDVGSGFGQKLGEFDLLCTEFFEGLRPETDFEKCASDFVASISCVRYSVSRSSITVSGSSSSFTVTEKSQVLPFGNISLQVAPA